MESENKPLGSELSPEETARLVAYGDTVLRMTHAEYLIDASILEAYEQAARRRAASHTTNPQ